MIRSLRSGPGERDLGRSTGTFLGVLATVGGVVLVLRYHPAPAQTTNAADTQTGNQMAASAPMNGANGTGMANGQKTTTTRTRTGNGGGMAGTSTNMNGGMGNGGGMSAGGMNANGTMANRNGRRTVNGPDVQTRWGNVQVQLTVSGGRIVAARTLRSPHSNSTSLAINQHALPILNQETVQANSGTIDAVSGATVTSTGYQTSLQAAVEAAHLA